MRSDMIRRAGRFLLVGGITAALAYGVFLACLRTGIGYIPASVVSWLAGLVVSFCLNKAVTFRDRRPADGGMVIRFLTVYLGQLLFGTATLAFMVEIVGLTPAIAYPANIVLTASFSFVMLSRTVFAARTSRSGLRGAA